MFLHKANVLHSLVVGSSLLLSSMACAAEPSSVIHEDQIPQMALSSAAEAPAGLPFNLALPADLHRCHQTEAIATYLDSLEPSDITSFSYLKAFLQDCQRVLAESMQADK